MITRHADVIRWIVSCAGFFCFQAVVNVLRALANFQEQMERKTKPVPRGLVGVPAPRTSKELANGKTH